MPPVREERRRSVLFQRFAGIVRSHFDLCGCMLCTVGVTDTRVFVADIGLVLVFMFQRPGIDENDAILPIHGVRPRKQTVLHSGSDVSDTPTVRQ